MSQRREFRELVSPDRVREVLKELQIEPPLETKPIENVRGRVLAERVTAPIDVPGFDRATMDGYAVRARDTFGADERDPAELQYCGSVHAGEAPDLVVDPGQAAEISTGAVMPPGADAVVMVERTKRRDDDVVDVETGLAPGDNVMVAGADIGAGRRLLEPGRHLTARDIAVLAATGHNRVQVRSPPRVGIVSTGDELVRPGADVDHDRGQIYDVNSHSIAAAVEDAGGAAHMYPHVGDDYDRMYEMLDRAADECDVVVSSGSTSASAVDVIYRVIEERGELLVHGVAMKPGKPMIVGRMGEAAYIGLPGYPVSALMVFRHLVSDRIRAAAGLGNRASPTADARMAAEERFGEGRMRLLPVGTVRDGEGTLLAYPVDKGSGATTSLSDADGVVRVPQDTAFVGTGEDVTVELFSENVEPPDVLAAGTEDPTFLDALATAGTSRFLPVGSREGTRRLERGILDIAIIADGEPPSTGSRVGTWTREWGLLVPDGNPDGIASPADIVDGALQFANLQGAAPRSAFDDRLSELARERDTTRTQLINDITGYGRGRTTPESVARRISRGQADVGLGFADTADHHDLGFVGLGDITVEVYVADDRANKPGVRRVIDQL